MTIDELLKTPYWIIDILPQQVPKDSPGQYFAVADYWHSEPQRTAIKQKHIDLILKLNCYRDLYLDEEETPNPRPEILVGEMLMRYLCIKVDDAMIVSDPEDTYLTLYNPNEKLLELVKTLAGGEGLFVWQPA